MPLSADEAAEVELLPANLGQESTQDADGTGAAAAASAAVTTPLQAMAASMAAGMVGFKSCLLLRLYRCMCLPVLHCLLSPSRLVQRRAYYVYAV